jgi:hypothetical protein
MEANRKEECDFSFNRNGEIWNIVEVWIQNDGTIAWYVGYAVRFKNNLTPNGIKFWRTFEPGEIAGHDPKRLVVLDVDGFKTSDPQDV